MRYNEIFEKIHWAIGNDVNKAQQFSQKDQADKYFSLIWVNIKKLLNNTNTDQKLDVNDPTGGENKIGNRIEKAMSHFSNGEYMDPSIVSLGYRGLDFTDGRHRLVAAYRLGARVAPILVPTEQVNEIMELLK